VTEDDCGTGNGVAMRHWSRERIIEALRDRIRVAGVVDIAHPDTQDPLFVAGTLLDEDAVDRIEQLGIDEVKVRTRCRATPATASPVLRRIWVAEPGQRRRGVGVIAPIDRRARHAAHDAHLPHRCAASRPRCKAAIEAKSNGLIPLPAPCAM